MHLALDGALRTDSFISGEQMYAVTMTWSGTQIAMVYLSMVATSVVTAPQTLFVHVSQAGALLGSPLELDATNDYGAYPVFSIDEDTVVLEVPDTGAQSARHRAPITCRSAQVGTHADRTSGPDHVVRDGPSGGRTRSWRGLIRLRTSTMAIQRTRWCRIGWGFRG